MAAKVKDDRKWVGREYGTVSSYSSLPEVMKELEKALEAEKRGEWRDLELEVQEHDYGGGSYIAIMGYRPENERERAERLTQEGEWAKKQEERDRAEFERLKAKYAKP